MEDFMVKPLALAVTLSLALGAAAMAAGEPRKSTAAAPDPMASCPMHAQHMAAENAGHSKADGSAEHGAGVDARHDTFGMSRSTSTHSFRQLADGGAIELRANDANDRATIDAIRTHLRQVAAQFKKADFSTPAFVHGYNTSSVPAASFPAPDAVTRFYREERSKLRNVRLEKVLGWLQADLDYLTAHPDLDAAGIRRIKDQTGIAVFDAVLIDGSEFTGEVEMPEVYGARFLMLDDTRSYKNWRNLKKLEADKGYRVVKKSRWTRNGWAVFERTR